MGLNKCGCGRRSKSRFFVVLAAAAYADAIYHVYFCSSKCLHTATGDFLITNNGIENPDDVILEDEKIPR